MSIVDILLGSPLASDEARAEEIGVSAGIPIFGLDALSSAAYGPEAALTLLIPPSAAGISHIVPISGSIIVINVPWYLETCAAESCAPQEFANFRAIIQGVQNCTADGARHL